MVCLPNGAPLCEKCPAAHLCAAYQQGRTGELPVKAPKKSRREEERTVYLLFWEDCVALRRRPAKGLLAGLWEYPNAPTGEDTLSQWGLHPVRTERAGTARHIFTHIQWNMEGVAAELDSPELPQGWVWASRGALEREYAVPNAFQGFQKAVEQRLGRV